MRPAWVVLYAWLALYPLVGWQQGTLWPAHITAVVALGVCVLPGLLRQASVPIGVPALAVLAALASLGLAVSAAPSSLPRGEMQWTAVTGAAHALFFLLCLAAMPDADASPDEIARARRSLALLLASIVIGQAFAVWGPFAEPSTRPSGTLGNPNTLGAVAAACGLALAGLFGLTPLAFLLLLPALPLLLVTGSRGAGAAFAVAAMVLAVRRRRWKLLAALAAAGVLVFVVPNPLVERMGRLQSEHSFTRPFLWGAALESIAEHPLGIGPSMNEYVFPAHAWDAEHPWLLHQRHSVGLTHNALLTLTLEWGWLAGAAALLFSGWAVLVLLRRPRPPGRDDRLYSGAALGATVLFVEMQVDGLEANPIACSLFLALAACVLARLPRGAGGPALSGRLVALLLGLALAALTGVGLWRTHGLGYERAADEAVAAWLAGRTGLDNARAALDRAESAHPREEKVATLRCDLEEANLRRLLGSPASDAQVLLAAERTRAALDWARAVNPAEPSLPRRAAKLENKIFFRTGRREDWEARSMEALRAVLALDPLDVETRWELANVAQRTGMRALRDEQVKIVFELEPDYALAWDGLARLLEAEGDLEGALHAYVRAEEALLNCAIKVKFPEAESSAFYRNNLGTVDLASVRARIKSLRETLYF
jgi:O-antigen ligase